MIEHIKMLQNIQWIARSDFLHPEVTFGPVCREYFGKYLVKTCEQIVLFYFQNCIPSCEFWFSMLGESFRLEDNDGLLWEAESAGVSATLTPIGLLAIAVDLGGNPLLLDVQTGRLYHVPFKLVSSAMRDETGQCARVTEFIAVTKEDIIRKATWSFDCIPEFVARARKETEESLVADIWENILALEPAYFEHLISLNLDLHVHNADGRNPAEEAEFLGKIEIARILRNYLEIK